MLSCAGKHGMRKKRAGMRVEPASGPPARFQLCRESDIVEGGPMARVGSVCVLLSWEYEGPMLADTPADADL